MLRILLWLLSAAAETEVRVAVIHDSVVGNRNFTPPVSSMVTFVVVKCAYDLSILCSLALFPVDGNFCVTVAVRSLGADLSAGLPASGIPCHHLVVTATSSSWGRASSTGRSRCHVERLPRQVIRWVSVVTRRKEVLRQTTFAVEHGETRRFSNFGQQSFQTGDLDDIKM